VPIFRLAWKQAVFFRFRGGPTVPGHDVLSVNSSDCDSIDPPKSFRFPGLYIDRDCRSTRCCKRFSERSRSSQCLPSCLLKASLREYIDFLYVVVINILAIVTASAKVSYCLLSFFSFFTTAPLKVRLCVSF